MITGEFCIVSAERPEYSKDENTARLIAARSMALAAGHTVVMVDGAWAGVAEHSLQISGHGAVWTAEAIAQAFDQDSYLDVGNGVARLCDRYGSVLAIFSQTVAAPANSPNYTILDGERILFAA